jgi:hypothetical protein
MSTSTPWGPSDQSHKYAPGIILYQGTRGTGFRISEKKFNRISPKLRKLAVSKGWIPEQNKEAVVLSFPHLFSSDEIKMARTNLRRKYPQIYKSLIK